MTLSMGPATDYLVVLATAAVVGVTVNTKPVAVSDGPPNELDFGMFVVGLADGPPDLTGETTGTRVWGTIAGVAGSQVEEDYVIPCYIDILDPASQKHARDTASQVFDAFWSGLRADLTLGGLLNGMAAEIIDLRFIPRSVGTAAEPGYRQTIAFGVHCRRFTL